VSRAAVLGAGSWGTALAALLAGKGVDTVLWGRDADAMERMRSSRANGRYLPGVTLPESLAITADVETTRERDLILAVPTRAQRSVARGVAERGGARRVLCVAKGYEPDTRKRMSEVLREELGPEPGIALLAGPSHAEEVALGIPTTVVVASTDDDTAAAFQDLLLTPTFRVYTNPDLVGAETAAALKNVIAIAAGICDGLSFGDNTKGALLTRGLAEITRLGVELGARPETFFGLAGIGDLVTTCMSGHSRNRGVGELIAQGLLLDEACERTGMVAEGVQTTRSAVEIARAHGVELPITEQVSQVLFGGKDPRKALMELMGRDAKAEVG